MKKIIKLNENDIENLVKKIIKEDRLQELDKLTYDSAAEKASERGIPALSDRFRKHGQEHGLGKEKEQFTLVIDHSSLGEREYTYKVESVEEMEDGKTLKIKLVDIDNPQNVHTYTGSIRLTNPNKNSRSLKRGDYKLILYFRDNYYTLAKTRKDAKNLLNMLIKNMGGKHMFHPLKNIDPRTLTLGYSNFGENIKRRKTLSEDRTDYEMSGARSRKDYVSNPRERDITGMFGKYSEDVPPMVIRYMRKNPEAIVKRLYKIYGDKIYDYIPQQVDMDLVRNNPNDADLGAQVRSRFNSENINECGEGGYMTEDGCVDYVEENRRPRRISESNGKGCADTEKGCIRKRKSGWVILNNKKGGVWRKCSSRKNCEEQLDAYHANQ